jgi:hypothetical protein
MVHLRMAFQAEREPLSFARLLVYFKLPILLKLPFHLRLLIILKFVIDLNLHFHVKLFVNLKFFNPNLPANFHT